MSTADAPSAGAQPHTLFVRWLTWMLLLNLAWEIAQVSLYTLPSPPFRFFTAYSIAHCTLGDGLIASAIYVAARLAG
jgi:hypothetical protein